MIINSDLAIILIVCHFALHPSTFNTDKSISWFLNQLCMAFRAGSSTLMVISVRSSFTFSRETHRLSSKRQLLGMESSSSFMSSTAVLFADHADIYTGRIHTDDPFLPIKGKRDESIVFSVRKRLEILTAAIAEIERKALESFKLSLESKPLQMGFAL